MEYEAVVGVGTLVGQMAASVGAAYAETALVLVATWMHKTRGKTSSVRLQLELELHLSPLHNSFEMLLRALVHRRPSQPLRSLCYGGVSFEGLLQPRTCAAIDQIWSLERVTIVARRKGKVAMFANIALVVVQIAMILINSASQ